MAEEDFEAISQVRQPWGWTEAFCSFQEAGKGRGLVGLCVITSQLLATAKVSCYGLKSQQAHGMVIWLLIPHFLQASIFV